TSFLATDLFRLWPLPSLNLTKSIHHQAPICKYYIYIDCTSSRNIFSNCFHQPTMSITTIPDLCRLMIFEQLPPKDLLNIHLVDPSWTALQSHACRKRRSLVLTSGPNPTAVLNSCTFDAPFRSHGLTDMISFASIKTK